MLCDSHVFCIESHHPCTHFHTPIPLLHMVAHWNEVDSQNCVEQTGASGLHAPCTIHRYSFLPLIPCPHHPRSGSIITRTHKIQWKVGCEMHWLLPYSWQQHFLILGYIVDISELTVGTIFSLNHLITYLNVMCLLGVLVLFHNTRHEVYSRC